MAIEAAKAPVRPAVLRGAGVSCALLTVFTILLAWPSPPPALAVLVRPGYFALLWFFFFWTSRGSPELRGQAMRLVLVGVFVLWLAFTCSAAIYFLDLEPTHASVSYLRQVCERGAMFLLGTTLISFGLMLWIPQVVQSHRLLAEHAAMQRGRLEVAETTQSLLERRLIDADRRGLLGELAATIAHDLRNPLAIVKGTAESLSRKVRTPSELAEHTDVIRRNVDKADRTITSLIDLGRPRAKEPKERAARDVLGEVAVLVAVEARRRRLRVDVLVDDHGEPTTVHADGTLLAQALLNLVLNAVQATPPEGHILLRARRWYVAGKRRVAIAIEDRGSGLPRTVRDRLFTPFFTTKPEGTGLGLSSCRRIAKELGGWLDLRPRHRGGARAILLLPATDGSAAEAAPPSPAGTSGGVP
ncbi:MAG: HAMP domain-containing histidine kinase [Planctomycetes bacterium]|nr:HAMP domain-containing histidine kinase [Planctomycetota bacterium]